MFITASLAETEAAFDTLRLELAPNAAAAAFAGSGLPGEGPDVGAPLGFHDYGFEDVNLFSDLDYREVRTTVGLNYRISPSVSWFTSVSYYDLEDDSLDELQPGQPILQDFTGSVTWVQGGLTWRY